MEYKIKKNWGKSRQQEESIAAAPGCDTVSQKSQIVCFYFLEWSLKFTLFLKASYVIESMTYMLQFVQGLIKIT